MQEPGTGQSQGQQPLQTQPLEQQPMQAQPMQTPPSYSAPIPAPTEYAPAPMTGGGMMGANTSGTGAQAVLPEELKGFSWAACLMTWIWAIGHQFWLGLVSIPIGFVIGAIPVINLFGWIAINIVFGIKGNEWAWQHRRWDSIEQFKATQRVWTIWGVALTLLAVVFIGIAFMVAGTAVFSAMQGNPQAFQQRP